VRKDSHGALLLTEKARPVLYQGARVNMPVKVQRKEHPAFQKEEPVVIPDASEEGLLEFLKLVRAEIAKKENVPAYVVFPNATLRDMARKRPRNRRELLQVSGVGEIRADRYGDQFLTAIQIHGQLH